MATGLCTPRTEMLFKHVLNEGKTKHTLETVANRSSANFRNANLRPLTEVPFLLT